MKIGHAARWAAVVISGAGLGFVAASGHSASLLGPEGKFSTFISSLKWEPGYGCSKPYKPYQWDDYSRQSYISDGKRYLDCIKRQADKDAEYAVDVVYDGYKEAADDFLNEVRRGY